MRTGPTLALGTVQFGLPYGLSGAAEPVTPDTVRAILSKAADSGVTRLDTAAGYGDIEERLPSLIGDLPFEVVSKIPAPPPALPAAEIPAFVGLAIETSLNRLGGLLAGLLFHDPALVAGPGGDELWAMAEDRCQQKGISLGVSGYDPAHVAELAERHPFAMAQLPANAFDQRIAGMDVGGCELTARSLFLQGLLLMPAEQADLRVPGSGPAVARWTRWCDDQAVTLLEGALAVAKAFDCAYAVVGVDSLPQWEQIADAWSRVSPVAAPGLALDSPAITDPRGWRRHSEIVQS